MSRFVVAAIVLTVSACTLSACGSHDRTAKSSPVASPLGSNAASSATTPASSTPVASSTQPAQAAASRATSIASTSTPAGPWDPDSSVCELLTPVARQSMGLEPLPMGTTQAPSECVVTFHETTDGLTPKLTLTRIQDTVDRQVTTFQHGASDAAVSAASGPTGSAKWVFAHGNPDLIMLIWPGADGYAWTLEAEVANPSTRKPAMLEAARQINARIPSK